MKTRNQVVASAKTKVAPETANDASNQSTRNEPSGSMPNQSPSTPRLRERKASSMEPKSQSGSAVVNNRVPSSTADAKRPLIVQNRLLRQRSSSKSTSLLAPDPQSKSSSSINGSGSTSNKSSELTGSKKDTQQCQQTAASLSDPMDNQSPEELNLANNKTANIEDYSRDVSSIKLKIAKQPTSANGSVNTGSKPVRISLPNNSGIKGIDSSVDPLYCTSSNAPNDKNKSMLDIDELEKTGTDDSKSDVSQTSTQEDSRLALNTKNDSLDSTYVNHSHPRSVFNVLIGVTGSVATIKLTQLILKLKSSFPRTYNKKSDGSPNEVSIAIKVIMTNSSKHFIPKDELIKTIDDESIDIHDDADEWGLWKKMGDPVLHIELRKWADICLIAPLDANTMAKLANGICDNLLTCVVRAWDVSKPLVYCPAMNVHMYTHPLTREHLSKLQSFGYLRVDCIEKRLACGDVGIGGMATVDTITTKVIECLIQPKPRALSRPLLDQQPTYPIISTSDEDQGSPNGKKLSSPVSAHQLLNRFRSNNQITIHAVAKNNEKFQSGSRLDEIAALALKRRKMMNSSSSSHSYSSLIADKNSNRHHNLQNNLGQSNSKQKMGGVTSVQNLRAMALNEALVDCAPDLGQAEQVDDEEEDFVNFLDPSRLLEQSMIIDDSLAFPKQPNVNNITSLSTERSFPSSQRNGESLLKVGGLTPLLNTSKFLTLCQNKERGCFTCAICKHDYKNRKSMARHLKEQHVQGSIFHCKPCGVSYKRREKLIKHNRERHGII